MMTRSHLVVALAAGILGLVVGRAIPRGAPSSDTPASVVAPPPVAARPDSSATRAELASTRTQLAICMAYCGASATPVPSTEPPPPSLPPQGLAGFAAWAAARKPNERLENYPEAVLARGPDGRHVIYRPDEHSVENDDVYAKKLLDGNILYYLGPDAGPRTDPNAWGKLEDLAGPDGWLIRDGKRVIRLWRPDAGAGAP